MHCNVLHEYLEVFVLGHEVGFAVDFDHDADLAAGVDIAADSPFRGSPARLWRQQPALLTQVIHGFLEITGAFLKGLLAIEHAGPVDFLSSLICAAVTAIISSFP